MFSLIDFPCDILHFIDGRHLLDHIHSLDGGTERHVILLDIQMPGMGGLEVLDKVKSNPKLRNIPVVMFTTSNEPREINTCQAKGCDGYFVKNFDSGNVSELGNKIAARLKSLTS